MNASLELSIPTTGADSDHDDVLQAVADRASAVFDLEGWNLDPRWSDDSREAVIVSVPEWAATRGRCARIAATVRS